MVGASDFRTRLVAHCWASQRASCLETWQQVIPVGITRANAPPVSGPGKYSAQAPLLLPEAVEKLRACSSIRQPRYSVGTYPSRTLDWQESRQLSLRLCSRRYPCATCSLSCKYSQ